jgi:8-oxo-dGTP pyrophosphatase MutT (NUDIX family)
MSDPLELRSNAFPISVKGVVVLEDAVVLLKNDRNEWELPGGRLELGEDPERCVAREIAEEVGWHIETGPILDAWMYHIFEGRDVFIVTYGCHLDAATGPPVLSAEHSEVRLFAEEEVPGLDMPAGYKKSIATWFGRLREDADGRRS